MLKISEIEKVVKEQLNALASRPELAEAIRSYRIDGGNEADRSWVVTGLYAYEDKHNRLVLETLYLESLGTCVVRVFKEGNLEILYARKMVAELEQLSLRVQEAGSVFLLHLAKPLAIQSVEGNYGIIAETLGQSVLQALLPIPPPISLEDLEG